MNSWGINRRMLVLALFPGVIIAVLLYGYFIQAQLALLDQSLNDRGSTIVQQLAPASEFAVATGNRDLLTRLATSVLREDEVIGIGIVDRDDVPLVRVGALQPDVSRLVRSARMGDICERDSMALVFCAPIYRTRLQVDDFPSADHVPPTPEVIGWVYVALTTAEIKNKRAEAVVEAMIITGLLLLVTGILAVWMGHHISEPIIELTKTVQEVAHGNLEVGKLKPGGGEIGTLQDGINQMIDSLNAARDEMELRVERATVQLRSTLTELEQKNHDLEEQKSKAQLASEAKGQFLANMSHEIRTPLSGILGMLALLDKTELQQSQRAYVANLSLAAKALHSLLNDILDLSRIEAGKLRLRLTPFSPRQVLDEVALMLAPSAHEKGLDLICHSARTLPGEVVGDSLRLRQVLINLTSNAIKFTESGTVILRAATVESSVADMTMIRFEVEDTGIGIPEAKQYSIFDSFTQLDSSSTRRYGGSGLGTTIAREIVQLMGGTIGVTSTEGKGSLFWFEVPWESAAVGTSAAVTSYAVGRPHEIMVVEANMDGQRSLSELGGELGIALQFVESEQSARELLARDYRPELVLLVEDTQQAQWLSLARELRKGRDGRLPLFGHVTFFNGDTEAALFDVHLNKPVTRDALRHMLAVLAEGMDTVAESGQTAAPIATRTVLVAEDNRINALVIQNFLALAGQRVVLAENGLEALKALGNGGIDLVFMDMRMPQLDGLEATRQWRQREGGMRRIPIVALTANATTEDREHCLAAGMDDFLSKPVEQEQLLAVLARYTEEKSVGNPVS